MGKTNFLGVPGDFSRVGSIDALQNIGWAKLPTYYYDVQQHQFPLSATEFAAGFEGTIKVFDEVAETPGHQTNAATGSGVNEPFLAYGVGIVAIAEGLSFTQTGAMVAAAGERGAVPCFDGCPGEGQTAAAMWWGGAGWDFIENFFQAYRLQLVVNNRWLLVDESLFDVGMSPTPPEFVGASSSTVPTMPFIQDVNKKLSDLGQTLAFIPQNQAAASACVPAPTAGVTYGHPRIIGLANRLFCFNQPIPYLPGMRFDMKFVPVENDAYFIEAMKRDSVYDPDNTSPIPGLDTDGACPSAVIYVPGGKISIGLVLKGIALHPRALVDFVESIPQGNAYTKMLEGNIFLSGLASQMAATGALRGNLAGIVNPGKDLGQ